MYFYYTKHFMLLFGSNIFPKQREFQSKSAYHNTLKKQEFEQKLRYAEHSRVKFQLDVNWIANVQQPTTSVQMGLEPPFLCYCILFSFQIIVIYWFTLQLPQFRKKKKCTPKKAPEVSDSLKTA